MKKGVCFAGLLMGLILLPSVPALANNVTDIDIDATVNQDGSMDVVQVWTGDFEEGTENYIPMVDGGVLEVSDFSVSENDLAYTTLDSWNIDADFDEKAGKCGINWTDDGFELCWGITAYGQHTYVIRYTMSHVMGAYDTVDATNYRFVNSDMNTGPTDATVTIRLADGTPITDDNCDIYAFGYDGQIEFSDGAIRAYTTSGITEDNYLTVLFALDKGLITPDRQGEGTFEDLKNRAMEGSDYENKKDRSLSDLIFVILVFLAIAATIVVIIGLAIAAAIEARRKKAFMKNATYFREAPNEGNLAASYVIGRGAGITNENDVIGSVLLRMVQKGYLEAQPDFSGFIERKQLVIMKAPAENEILETKMYEILVKAAGDDQILQEKEMNKYFERNSEKLRKFLEFCERRGEIYCNDRDTRLGMNFKMNDLTESGKKEFAEVAGLRNYLKDFSLIGERSLNETVIWQDYMVYAYLFGIADQVMKEMKKLYPQYAQEIETYHNDMATVMTLNHCMYYSMSSAEASRSSGSGGHSSFGGGGGSFGGGSGGGSR